MDKDVTIPISVNGGNNPTNLGTRVIRRDISNTENVRENQGNNNMVLYTHLNVKEGVSNREIYR